MFKLFTDEDGYTLVMIILIFVVLIVLGTALYYLVSSTYNVTYLNTLQKKAYYNARAGMQAVSFYLRNGGKFSDDYIGVVSDPVDISDELQDGHYTVEYLGTDSGKTVLRTTGVVPNPQDSSDFSEELIARLGPDFLIPEGVSGRTVEIYGSSWVDGEVGVRPDEEGKLGTIHIDNNACDIEGNIIYPGGNDFEDVVQIPSYTQPSDFGFQDIIHGTPPEASLPPFPSFPTGSLDADIVNESYGASEPNRELSVSSNAYICNTIDVNNMILTITVPSDEDVEIRVRELKMGGNPCEIRIDKAPGAEGRVIFYVEEIFDPASTATVNFTNGSSYEDVLMYYRGNDTLEIKNSACFNGSIYSHHADVEVGGGAGGTIINDNEEEITVPGVGGNILAGEYFANRGNVILEGAATAEGRIIIAKGDITLRGGAHYKGSINGDRILLEGHTSVTFDDSYDTTFVDDYLDYYTGGGSLKEHWRIEWIEVEDYIQAGEVE